MIAQYTYIIWILQEITKKSAWGRCRFFASLTRSKGSVPDSEQGNEGEGKAGINPD